MGLLFGHLYVIRGIVYYKLMPHECRPFAKMISEGLPNVFYRTYQSGLRWAPPLLFSYFLVKYIDYVHWLKHRKKASDYVNEVDPNPKVEDVEVKKETEKEKCEKKMKKKKKAAVESS